MIRKALHKDIDFINDLGLELSDDFKKLFHIESEIDNNMAIVLVSDNYGIDGFLYALSFGDNIDLLGIVVKKENRCQNIGSQLLEYLINNYCYHNISITLEVSIENISAIKLYRKFGFIDVNIRKGYYNGVDAILMKLENNCKEIKD